MAGLGDYLAQRAAASSGGVTASTTVSTGSPAKTRRSGPALDWKRSLTFIVKGLGEGLMWSFWYHQSDRVVNHIMSALVSAHWILAEASPLFVVVRTILSLVTDLFIACPIIYATWDIPLPALVKGMPLKKVARQIRLKLPEMMWASIKLWMPANIIIYNSPLKYRVILMSTADIFWQSMVSTIATREVADDSCFDATANSSHHSMEEGTSLLMDPNTNKVVKDDDTIESTLSSSSSFGNGDEFNIHAKSF
jgi:hypothetical protein